MNGEASAQGFGKLDIMPRGAPRAVQDDKSRTFTNGPPAYEPAGRHFHAMIGA